MAALSDPGSAPRVIAAIVLVLETSALAVATLAYVALALVDDGGSRQFLVGIAVLAALAAVGLGLAARGIVRSQRWAIAPALTWQVLQGVVGAYVLPGNSPVLGLSLLIPALVGGIALVLTARAATLSGG